MISGRYKNLATNTLLFAVNAVATKFVTFLLVPLYTSAMTAGEYGLTDMSVTVISLVTPLATLSIADAAVRFMVDDERRQGTYAFVGFAVTALSVLVVALLTPALKLGFFGGLGDYPQWFVLAYASTALLHYCGNVARGLGKIKVIPACAGASSLITCALAFVLVGNMGMTVDGYFISVSAGPMVAVLLYFSYGGIWRSLLSGFRDVSGLAPGRSGVAELLRPMLRYSLPLVPNALLWWAGMGINRFFITGILGIVASGLYAAASKIPTLINAVYAIFQQAWQLSSFQESKSESISSFFETVFTLVQACMTVLCAGVCLLSPVLGAIMLRGETYESWPMIGLLVLANLMNVFNSFYGTVYTSTMNTSLIMTTTVVGAVTCTVLTPLLIGPLGISGACLASVAGQGLVFAVRARRSREFISFDPRWRVLLPTLAILTVQSLFTGFQVRGWQGVSVACFAVVACLQGGGVYRLRARRKASG